MSGNYNGYGEPPAEKLGRGRPKKLPKAKGWLKNYLSRGMKSVVGILGTKNESGRWLNNGAAGAAGYSRGLMVQAKVALYIQSIRVGGDATGGWFWWDPETPRPEPDSLLQIAQQARGAIITLGKQPSAEDIENGRQAADTLDQKTLTEPDPNQYELDGKLIDEEIPKRVKRGDTAWSIFKWATDLMHEHFGPFQKPVDFEPSLWPFTPGDLQVAIVDSKQKLDLNSDVEKWAIFEPVSKPEYEDF
jgi:hypothetical protein